MCDWIEFVDGVSTKQGKIKWRAHKLIKLISQINYKD